MEGAVRHSRGRNRPLRRCRQRARKYFAEERLIVITYVVIIIIVAFAFDFSNGFHDSANSIATVVGTRVLSPLAAVAWAALFNFAAAFTVGTAVARTVGTGM